MQHHSATQCFWRNVQQSAVSNERGAQEIFNAYDACADRPLGLEMSRQDEYDAFDFPKICSK